MEKSKASGFGNFFAMCAGLLVLTGIGSQRRRVIMKKLTSFTTRTLIVFAAFFWTLSSVAEAATIEVDCSSASLQAAINKAKPGDTLLVSGTCKENLVIHEEVARLTLDGQGKATIEGSEKKPTIQVRGRGITIKGFTVTGGLQGINVWGGQAIIDGNTVQGAARAGIFVTRTSYAGIVNNTVQNNGTNGIGISANSFGFVGALRASDRTASPNIVQNNGRTGITVARSSAARIVGNTIRNNKRRGISVVLTSQVDITNNTIDSNGGPGIRVIQNSHVRLGRRRGSGIFRLPNSTTSNNSRAGIRCRGNSSVEGRLGSLNGEEGVKDIGPSCIDSLKP